MDGWDPTQKSSPARAPSGANKHVFDIRICTVINQLDWKIAQLFGETRTQTKAARWSALTLGK